MAHHPANGRAVNLIELNESWFKLVQWSPQSLVSNGFMENHQCKGTSLLSGPGVPIGDSDGSGNEGEES